MVFNKAVYFQRIKPGKYEEETGNYGDDTPEEELRYADVTEAATETVQLIYGTIKQGCLTIRLQRVYDKPFDRIRIGTKVYRVDWNKKMLSGKHVFVVSEVQGNG